MNSDMNTLENKIMSAFAGKVVRKDLAFAVKGGLPVPTYVLEYLLGQYCATNDEAQIHEGLEKVKDIIRNNYINRAEAEVTKGKIKELGKFSIIDKISATLNEKQDCYEATFANLRTSLRRTLNSFQATEFGVLLLLVILRAKMCQLVGIYACSNLYRSPISLWLIMWTNAIYSPRTSGLISLSRRSDSILKHSTDARSLSLSLV